MKPFMLMVDCCCCGPELRPLKIIDGPAEPALPFGVFGFVPPSMFRFIPPMPLEFMPSRILDDIVDWCVDGIAGVDDVVFTFDPVLSSLGVFGVWKNLANFEPRPGALAAAASDP